jgi:vitamin K-dependent gamma-carboxylase
VAFGTIMFWEVCRYFIYDWVERYYVQPEFRFTYYGFDWLRLWSGEWMHLHFLFLGALALMIALGVLYRLSMTLFFLGFSYVFLFDQSLYLNHFYLICLISLTMIFIPAHRAVSFDARLCPGIRSDTAPAWALGLPAAQVGIAYLYGGLAKLNGDWLQGEPTRMWLAYKTDFPIIGRWFTEEWIVYAFSYGVLLFDLLVVPFLLWQRTRPFTFATAVVFHLTNANLFQIGIFPFLMIAATLLFFPPSWPRRLANLLRREPAHRETDGPAGARPAASRLWSPTPPSSVRSFDEQQTRPDGSNSSDRETDGRSRRVEVSAGEAQILERA